MTDNSPDSKVNLYLVEMVVEVLKVFGNVGEEDTCPKVVQLLFNDEIFIEIHENEFGGNLNDELKGKNCIFSLGRHFENISMKICVYKITDDNKKELIGTYDTPAQKIFDDITNKYDAYAQRVKLPSQEKGLVQTLYSYPGGAIQQPAGAKTTSETHRNVYPLIDSNNISRGFVLAAFRISCFGPKVSQTMSSCAPKDRVHVKDCEMINHTPDNCDHYLAKHTPKEKDCCPPPPSTPPRSDISGADVDDSYNEYKAEMNGNSLVVKITKSYQLVTNVYDNKKEGGGENKLNYCTDGKKLKFEIPTHGSRDCGNKSQPKLMCQLPPMICRPACSRPNKRPKTSQTSCCVCHVPVVKGNKKYPSTVTLERKYSNPCPAPCPCPSAKPRSTKPERHICIQCNGKEIDDNMVVDPLEEEALEGTHGILTGHLPPEPEEGMEVPLTQAQPEKPPGIEVCKKGWHDTNTESYVLKIAKCKKGGQGNEKGVDFEIRIPKGPATDPPRKETRGCQVLEDEFSTAGGAGSKKGSKKGGKKGGKKGKKGAKKGKKK